MTAAISDRIEQLTRERVPFVRATVVRAQEPTSAHAGDRAIVLADGSVEGFVGGLCATGSVRTAALDVLASGEGLLLRVLPDGAADFPASPGASVVVNPCLSGGALEIYLEPRLPPARLHLVGTSPVADAVAVLAEAVGLTVDRASTGAVVWGAAALVVASHDGMEAPEVRSALDAGVGFVALVCSRTRGRALMEQLDLTPQERTRVHPHAGVDIGARTAPEIALSVVAAVVRAIRVDGLTATLPDGHPGAVPSPTTALDPVCGMTVTVTDDTPSAVVDGVTHWFCRPGCRDTFVTAPAADAS